MWGSSWIEIRFSSRGLERLNRDPNENWNRVYFNHNLNTKSSVFAMGKFSMRIRWQLRVVGLQTHTEAIQLLEKWLVLHKLDLENRTGEYCVLFSFMHNINLWICWRLETTVKVVRCSFCFERKYRTPIQAPHAVPIFSQFSLPRNLPLLKLRIFYVVVSWWRKKERKCWRPINLIIPSINFFSAEE